MTAFAIGIRTFTILKQIGIAILFYFLEFFLVFLFLHLYQCYILYICILHNIILSAHLYK